MMKMRWMVRLALPVLLVLAAGCGDDDSEAPSKCKKLIEPLAGTYVVINEVVRDRGTITVHADGEIDFDEKIHYEARDIETCDDYLSEEHDRRVQISYGMDDDSPVINLYLPSGKTAEDVTMIEYRHRDLGIEVRAEVEYQP